jgi:hypothetical protein
MRITDFLGRYLDGIERVVERHSGSLSLEPYLALPDGVTHERARERAPTGARTRRGDRDVGADVLLLGLLGPDPERYGREEEALALLAGLGQGQRCAIVFGHPTPALPIHRLLDALSESGSQLVQVSSLEHQQFHGAAMAIQTGDRLAMARDPFGTTLVPEPADTFEPDVIRRLANEFVLLDFVARNLRAQVFRLGGSSVEGGDAVRRRDELERWTEQARAQAEQSRADAEAAKANAELARVETEAAQQEADELRREAARLRAEVDRIAGSTSFLLGHRLVETARHPGNAPGLPVDLVRIWRRRGQAKDGATATAPTNRPPPPAARPPEPGAGPTPITAVRPAGEDEQRRFVAHLAFEARPRVRPVIAGILTDATAGALQVDAVVNRLTPNDARLVIERTEPDLVLVETAAFGAGRPWSYTGDPAATDRSARLLEVIDVARSLGGSAVLIRDARQPAAAGLIPLESRFDLVLDAQGTVGHDVGWSRGVQLARFHPLGRPPSPDPRPLFVGGVSPRQPAALRAFSAETISAVASLGLDVLADPGGPIDHVEPIAGEGAIRADRLSWEDAARVYRARAIGLANPVSVPDAVTVIEPGILEQLACGMRIVSGPHLSLAAAFGGDVQFVREPGEAVAVMREALRQPAPSPLEMRSLLRALFEGHATPVMLSALTRRFPSMPDPLSGRRVTAVVVGDRLDRGVVIESLVHQSHRPAEVLLGGDGEWSAAERSALEAANIPSRALEGDGDEVRWSMVGSVADTEWLTVWPIDRPVGSCYLLDLLVGAELSRADVVAYSGQPLDHVDRVDLGTAIVRRPVASAQLVAQPIVRAERSFEARDGLRALSVGPEEPVP